MFGAFTPGDSFRVYRLQRRGVSLDLQRDLTHAHTPLWEACLAFLTQQAMGQPTYVLYDPHDGEAFLQMRYRPHQAAADVTYLAPALEGNHRVTGAWSRLLDGACIEAAGRGIQRVFANLAESGAELDVFHQAGFTPYASEEVFVLPRVEAGRFRRDGLGLRLQRPEDWPAIQKLCVAITPQRVRQAEGGIAVTTGREKDCQRFVLAGKGGEAVVAVLNVCTGGLGHWLRVLIHPGSRDLAERLICQGLASVQDLDGRPVYCNVRQYESGVRSALDAIGFQAHDRRVLMVKHTVAWIKTPAPEMVPALKSSAEVAPPAYRLDGEPDLQPSRGRLRVERDA